MVGTFAAFRFLVPLTVSSGCASPCRAYAELTAWFSWVLRVPDSTLNLPCIVFALAREAMAFWREFPARQRIRVAPCPVWIAGPLSRTVMVVESGLGQEAMETAVSHALTGFRFDDISLRPRFLVLAGFSGALGPGRPVGHLVFATEVVDEHGGRWPTTWTNDIHAGRQLEKGSVLTANALVTDPESKRELGARHGAVAVDLESATAARICQQRGVPFGCLRAISDDAEMPLSPALVNLLRAGRPSPMAVLGALLRRPRLVNELRVLARNTRIASRQLARALCEVLPESS
jgi:adenosylhomocysteine nucleosidase